MKQFEIEMIKQAILNEIEGYEFYKLAGGQASTTEVKQAFEQLASEELEHVKWLERLFENMRDDASDSEMLQSLPNPPTPGIFKWDALDRSNAGVAVSVFGIGMQMEEASVKFYEEAARKTENTEAKKLFSLLVQWEQVHFEQFSKEYENLKKQWWSHQSYAPF